MTSCWRPVFVLLVLATVCLGFVYPLAVTAVAQFLFPHQANGSLIVVDGRPIGSWLVGQTFSQPGFFWGRPSATAPRPYQASASLGSNLGPTNPALRQAVKERIAAWQRADPENRLPIPIELVTTSGSGLDPHISPAGARYQVSRVARNRGLPEEQVRRLVAESVEPWPAVLFGEPRVNVLGLNLALEQLAEGRRK